MKKLLALLLCLAMVFSMVACGGSNTDETEAQETEAQGTEAQGTGAESSIAGATIEVATRQADDTLEALKALIAQFEEETGVTVELTEYSTEDYEAALKTRMSSNELPDIWETHGWSRLRYGEYLYPVNDEEWYMSMNDLARGILEGDGDTGYALMLDTSLLGIVCNLTKCEELGIDPYSWETLDDYVADCQKAVDAGVVPMATGRSGGDLTHMAGLWTTYPTAPYQHAAEQLDGTWDWEDNMDQLEWMAANLEAGFYWDDTTTNDSATVNERIATGQSLFYLANGNGYCKTLHDLNPDNEFIVVPFPAVEEGADMYIAGGEGYAIGIWNETEELDACRAYLAFMAENGTPLVGSMSAVDGLGDNEDNYGVAAAIDCMEKYPDVVYVNMWDREYMPSGMWGVYGEAVGMLYADWSEENLVKINEFLKTNYQEKWAAANG